MIKNNIGGIMKKYIGIISIILIFCFILSGCAGTGANNGENAGNATTTDAQDETPAAVYDENGLVTITYDDKEESGYGSAELKVSGRYSSGKKITVTIPEGQHFLAITIAKDVLEESILYLKNDKFSYTVPSSFTASYPSDMQRTGCVISARIPTVDELSANHNLALNTSDLVNAKNIYPHATSNNVYQDNNSPEWQARNIIDGFTQNTAHGTYPYQSWGPNSTVASKDYVKIDFGHDVSVEELILYIRADFDHDGYWGSCTVEFSDGSTMDINGIKKTNKAQTFTFDAPIVTSSLKFSGFEKGSNSVGDWCAWVELQATGTEIVSGIGG